MCCCCVRFRQRFRFVTVVQVVPTVEDGGQRSLNGGGLSGMANIVGSGKKKLGWIAQYERNGWFKVELNLNMVIWRDKRCYCSGLFFCWDGKNVCFYAVISCSMSVIFAGTVGEGMKNVMCVEKNGINGWWYLEIKNHKKTNLKEIILYIFFCFLFYFLPTREYLEKGVIF